MSSTTKWDHIVFTNDPKLIPNSVKTLEKNGIAFINIYAYQEKIPRIDLIGSLIENQNLLGMAADVFKLFAIYHFGGVYADLNFVFTSNLEDARHQYNFLALSNDDTFDIDNYFFMASKGHPVLDRAFELIDRNSYKSGKLPSYIAPYLESNDQAELTSVLTALPLELAYYQRSNLKGNIDVIYPKIHHHYLEDYRFNHKDQYTELP